MNFKKFLFAIIILIIILSGMYFIATNNDINNIIETEPNPETEKSEEEVTKSDGSEFLMDTLVRLRVDDQKSQEVLNEAFKKLRFLEDKLSKTITESDVYKINTNAGSKPVKVSEETYELLKEAYDFAERTDGIFDPTIGPLVSLWGIGTKDQKVPDEDE